MKNVNLISTNIIYLNRSKPTFIHNIKYGQDTNVSH